MIDNSNTPIHVLLYEGNDSTELSSDQRFEIMSGLLDRGFSVTRITRSGINGTSHLDSTRILVLGNFGDNQLEIEDAKNQTSIESRNIEGLDTDGVFKLVDTFRDGRGMNQPPAAGGTSWKPWFPVIDYDRCTNCMQCLSFCLFDVYSIDKDQKIQVDNQDNCKTNCPACSRVCPEVAIMFPKYSASPINGGEVSDQDVKREKLKVDISALLGGDIHANLRARSESAKTRFSKERSPDKALGEREKCLKKLQSDGFIPAEVLASIDIKSLPSREEIQQKAEMAAAAVKANQEKES